MQTFLGPLTGPAVLDQYLWLGIYSISLTVVTTRPGWRFLSLTQVVDMDCKCRPQTTAENTAGVPLGHFEELDEELGFDPEATTGGVVLQVPDISALVHRFFA